MKTSSIEITEQEYLIKLRKEDFELSFINQLLKRIQAEQLFFNFKNRIENDDDIISKQRDADTSTRFDRLDEK